MQGYPKLFSTDNTSQNLITMITTMRRMLSIIIFIKVLDLWRH